VGPGRHQVVCWGGADLLHRAFLFPSPTTFRDKRPGSRRSPPFQVFPETRDRSRHGAKRNIGPVSLLFVPLVCTTCWQNGPASRKKQKKPSQIPLHPSSARLATSARSSWDGNNRQSVIFQQPGKQDFSDSQAFPPRAPAACPPAIFLNLLPTSGMVLPQISVNFSNLIDSPKQTTIPLPCAPRQIDNDPGSPN